MSYYPWVKGDTSKPMVECHLRDAVAYAPLAGATVKLVYKGPSGRVERSAERVDANTGHVRYFASSADAAALTQAGNFPCQHVVTFADGKIQTYPNEGTDFIAVSLPI